MRNKIKEALKQGHKNLGLDEEVFERVAASVETFITDESTIEGFVNAESTKNLLKSYQSVADKARASVKKNEAKPNDPEPPANNPDPKPAEQTPNPMDMAKIIADAVANAIKPISDELAQFKGEQAAKAALSNAETKFFGNEYVKKYTDEAKDAWDVTNEIRKYNPNWTDEQIVTDAMARFNKAVSRKGVDTSKPFKSEGGSNADENLDMTKIMEIYKKSGRVADKQGN